MSSEGFNPNEALWARTGSLTENDFLIDEKASEELFFEGKPLSSLREASVAEIEEQVEDGVLIEISGDAEEIQPEEPAEKTVTFTESDYNEKLAQARAETESRLQAGLEEKFRLELSQLKDQQADFFGAVLKNLTSGDSLVSDIVSLSLKIGEALARSQLHLDEKVVSQFIESSIKRSEFNESDFVSIRVSNAWQSYRAVLNGRLPDGLGLLFDEALQPGEVVVSAGQGGYFDLLKDRVKMIEDQLSSIEHPGSAEWLADSFRRFTSEDTLDASEEMDQSERTQATGDDEPAISADDSDQVEESDSSPVPVIGESATISQPDEINSEQAAPTDPENQERGNSLEPGTESGLETDIDETD